ncbi:ABC transporter substrate-binding protein [Nocardioides pakistanensis]
MRAGMVRKVGVAAVASLAMMTVAACGGSDSAGSGGADEVLIGGLWATSGGQAVYGDYFESGARLAVNDINADGGIGGELPIKLEVQDTQALPEPAVVALQKLVGEDVAMVLSSFSSQTLALMPIANSRKIPVMNGGAQSNALGDQGDFLLNTIPLLKNESEILAQYLVNEEDYRKAAVLYTSDDGGRSAKESFVEAYEAAGGKVVAEESGQYQGTDYRSQLTKLRNSGADVLVFGAFGQDTNNMVSQTREIGWDVPMANTSWAAIPDVLANKAAEGLILTSIPFNPEEGFVKRFEEEYGEKPTSSYIGNYYDAVTVFAQAYAKAMEDDDDVTGEDIIAAINDIGTFDSVYGSELTFKDGVASRPINVGVIENGAVKTLAENYGN